MKRTLVFFLLFIKRLCKKPSFLIILFLMPVLVLALKNVIKKDDEAINVALYDEGGDARVERTIKNLVNSSGSIHFYEAESTERLKAEVLTQKAECGFVFKEGLWDALVAEDAEGLIILYQNMKTTSADFAKEKLYADIYTNLSYDVLLNYIEEQEPDDGLEAEERDAYLKERYLKYITEGGVFTLSYMNGDNTVVKDIEDVADDNSYLLKPVRGILAVFMLMAAMAGAVFWAVDYKEGVYKTLGYTERPFVNIAVIFLPVLLAGLAALMSLYIGGVAGDAAGELLGIFAYCVLLTGFANLIRSLTSNPTVICSLIPMLAVISLVCCDILIDASHIVSAVNAVRLFVPPQYYLETAAGQRSCLLTAGIGLALAASGVLIDRSRKY